jgi:hypothetical protein
VKPEWHFNKVNPRFKNREATQGEFFASDSELRAFIREAVQNSLDARRPDYSGPVAVRIFLSGDSHALTPKTAKRYFRGGWEHFLSEKSGLRDAPGTDDPCHFIVCEDTGTTGLTGDTEQYHEIPGQRNPFYYFFRAEGQSNKSDGSPEHPESGRGRWGLGKFVFPRSSRIRTFFGLTLRSDDEQRLLVGQSILRSHQVDDVSYTPDGWFGKKPEKKEAAPPVDDPDFLEQFEEDFCLERGRESGLSIVVPFCDVSWNASDVIDCVVQDYFYAILKEQLVVSVEGPGTQTVIHSHSLSEIITQCSDVVRSQIEPILGLTVWSAEHSAASGRIQLSGAWSGNAPRWSKPNLDPHAFTQIQKAFLETGRAAVRVPMAIQQKGKDSQATFFDLYLERRKSDQHRKPVFIRDSLIISDVRCRPTREVSAIVIAEHPVIGQFLGDAENPAHTEWLEESSHFKGRYVHGAATLRFIRNAAPDLCQLLLEPGEPEETDLLLDVFSIGTDQNGIPVGFQSRRSVGTFSGATGRLAAVSGKTAGRKKMPCRVTRRKGGFRVIGRPDSDVPTQSIDIHVAYDRRGGNPLRNFSTADFRLDQQPIQIVSEGALAEAVRPNLLRLHPQSSSFCVVVTGFDVNRDLFLKTVLRAANDSQGGKSEIAERLE